MPKGQNSRTWCFTNFNLEFDYQAYLDSTTAEYVAYGLETCPTTQRQHHQGYVYFTEKRGSIKNIAKELGGCHVEPCKGSLQQNEDYCSKQGDLVEFGAKPQQGKRTDVATAIQAIQEGVMTADEMAVEHPTLYQQYGRTLSKAEDVILRKRFRTEMTKGIWIHGPTGSGKSHEAFQGFTPETHYVWKLNEKSGWQDGYSGQETVIINDFRGEIPYNEMLQLVDKWPHSVPRRGREPAPFLAKTVIVTSSLEPAQVYNRRAAEDKLEQLLRRFEVRCLGGQKNDPEVFDPEVVRGNTAPDLWVRPGDFDPGLMDVDM